MKEKRVDAKLTLFRLLFTPLQHLPNKRRGITPCINVRKYNPGVWGKFKAFDAIIPRGVGRRQNWK